MALSTLYPLALMPIRIETRFAEESGASVLLVRMFPDALHVDSHEPPLTSDEADAHAAWLASARDFDAFRTLHARVGTYRAEYVATLTSAERASVGTRAETWTRAPLARLLPAAWTVVVTPAGHAPIRVRSTAVRGPLAVGLAPDDPGTVSNEAITLTGDSAWLSSYGDAVQRGMAVTVTLPSTARNADRFDVVVYGLGDPSIADAELAQAGARELAACLTAHRFTDGLGVLDVGTATNHTGAERPPWSTAEDPLDTFARVSAAVARDGDGSVADALGEAFGTGVGPFALANNHDHASAERDIAAMHELLWPATLGYFFENLVSEVAPTRVEAVRQSFVQHVRSRGPLPCLRVGRTPYGVLPVTSLSRWRPRAGEWFDAGAIGVMQNLVTTWRGASDRVPRVGADGDGVERLATILSRAPVSTSFVARSVVGPQYATYLYDFVRMPLPAVWWARHREIAERGLEATRIAMPTARLARAVFAQEDVPLATPVVIDTSAVTEPSLAELVGLQLSALRARADHPGGTPLAYRLARHAMLAAYLHGARAILSGRGEPGPFVDPELVGLTPERSTTPVASPWTWLERPATPNGNESIAGLLDRLGRNAPVPAYAAARSGLEHVAQLPAARVDALVREALDLCAHRVDAWVTAVATARFDQMRETTPRGVLIGAYGWVEGLRRDHATPVREAITDEPGPLREARGAGYVHAPSLGHATAAALLRSGAVAHGGTPDSPFGIDLASNRARKGREVLEGLRTGSSLGAVLGRRFERALVESSSLVLGDLIPAFRRFASIADPAATSDAAREARVVDGHALVTRRAEIPWGQHGLPATGALGRQAIDRVIDELAASIDAAGDVVTAEGVYQLANGDATRAGAIGDVASRGAVPPAELGVLEHRAQGTGITHHVMVVVPAAAMASGWASTPRARAEPALEAWCAAMLGPANGFVARIAFDDASEVSITLDMLGIGAIDVALAADELVDRALDLARHRRGGGMPSLESSSIQDARAIGAELGRVIAASRPLVPNDIDAVYDADAVALLESRIESSLIDDTLAALAADARTGLLAASTLGVRGAVPSIDPGVWPQQVAAAIASLENRRSQLPTAGSVGSIEERVARAAARSRLLVGEVPLLVPLRLATTTSAAWTAALTGQTTITGDDPTIAYSWLAQHGSVREHTAALERTILVADLVEPRADAALDLRVLQSPVSAWIARAPVTGTAHNSYVVHAPLGVNTAAPVAGMFVDSWAEVVPENKATTGLAFHYDQPGARAPQAILLAVPPDDSPVWTEDVVEAILAETIDLVHIRPLDGELLENVGQFLPALYFAINLGGETASTDFFSEQG